MIYDISMSIYFEMPVFKNKQDKRPIIRVTRDFLSGSIYESRIDLDLHTGTHIDAPLHVVENGSTIESIDLNKVITKCKVVDLVTVEEKITNFDLERKSIEPGDFVLLKTKNSYHDQFSGEFVYLETGGADYLKNQKVKGVGIDSLGIERNQPGYPTHKVLLNHGIILLEGLRLADVKEGEYILCAIPMKIKGAEAAPVRAVLINIDNPSIVPTSFGTVRFPDYK